MSDIKQLHFKNIASESYGELAKKLSHICKESYGCDIDIRIIVAIPEYDSGRGDAILKLTRQFGVFPIELGNHSGELDLQALSELPHFSGLTLIVQSFPIDTRDLTNQKNSQALISERSEDSVRKGRLEVHVPTPVGVVSEISQASVKMLRQQIRVLSQYFTESKILKAGPIVYLSGFTYNSGSSHSGVLPASRIIPWYLFIGSRQRIKRVYRQPELEKFLRSVPEDDPKIVDLEEYISAMG